MTIESRAKAHLIRTGTVQAWTQWKKTAGGIAPGSRRFADEEPAEPFVWIFFNRDGTMSEYETSVESYRMFVRLYGVPVGRWRSSDDRSKADG